MSTRSVAIKRNERFVLWCASLDGGYFKVSIAVKSEQQLIKVCERELAQLQKNNNTIREERKEVG